MIRTLSLVLLLTLTAIVVAADSPAGQFAAIEQQWDASLQKIAELKQNFAKTTADQRQAIIDEFNATVAKLRELAPQRREAAIAAYKASPNEDPAVAEAVAEVLQGEIAQDRYDAAAELGDLLVQHKHPDPAVYDFAGRAAFARSEFDKAEQLWKQAVAMGGVLSDESAQYEAMLPQYKEWWAEEQAKRAAEAKANDLPRVKLTTSEGEIVVELFENEAPNTVANFIHLVEKGFYDGTVFHRVIPNFMAQGGDLTTAEGGQEPGYTIDCECYRDDARKHFRGSLSMAHAGKDTGGSQFFLTVMPTYWLNGQLRPDTNHTVFGRVTKGIEIVDSLKVDDQIESAEVLFKRDHDYQPKTNPVAKPEASGDAKTSDQ